MKWDANTLGRCIQMTHGVYFCVRASMCACVCVCVATGQQNGIVCTHACTCDTLPVNQHYACLPMHEVRTQWEQSSGSLLWRTAISSLFAAHSAFFTSFFLSHFFGCRAHTLPRNPWKPLDKLVAEKDFFLNRRDFFYYVFVEEQRQCWL